jgi:hypothetical protein
MGTGPEIRTAQLGAEPILDKAVPVKHRPWRTVDAGCTVARVPARGRRRGWRSAAERIGNMVFTASERWQKDANCDLFHADEHARRA